MEHLAGPMSPIKDLGRLLQDMDVHRLRAVVYRDVVGFYSVNSFFSLPWSVFVCVLKSGLHDHIQVCDSPIFLIDTFLKKVGIQCISSSLI